MTPEQHIKKIDERLKMGTIGAYCGIHYETNEIEEVREAFRAKIREEHDGCVGCKFEEHDGESYPCCACKQNYTDKYERLPRPTNIEIMREKSDQEIVDLLCGIISNDKTEIMDWLHKESEV